MNKSDLQTLTNLLTPKLYSFAYALIPDELQAQQIIVDAYAIFLVQEKNFISDYNYKGTKKDRSAITRYIMTNMVAQIYELGLKRSAQRRNLRKKDLGLYQSFYNLKTNHRAILFLREKLRYSIEAIQQTLSLEKYQVLEAIYNAQHNLISNNEAQNHVR